MPRYRETSTRRTTVESQYDSFTRREQEMESSMPYEPGASIFHEKIVIEKPSIEYISCGALMDDPHVEFRVCPRKEEEYFEGDENIIEETKFQPVDDVHVEYKFQHYDSLIRFNNAVMIINISGLPPERRALYRKKTELQRKVNTIVAPYCWKRGSCLWTKEVSVAAATQEDVKNLEHKFANRLHVTQARSTGICGVRRTIYTQLFDECIRQIMIHCPQRGELFVDVRNELNLSLEYLYKLFASAMAFGLRKSLYEKDIRENLKQDYQDLRRNRRILLENFDYVTKELKREAHESQLERDTLREEYDREIAELTVEVIGLRDQLWSYAQIPPHEEVAAGGKKRRSSKLKSTTTA